MFKRYLFQILIPFISFATVVTAGFGAWIFTNQTQNDQIAFGITIATKCELGEINLIGPTTLGYENYRIVFEQGGDNEIGNEDVGVNFVPNLVFDFNPIAEGSLGDDYANLSGYDFKYQLGFDVENNIAFNTYAEFVENQEGFLNVDLTAGTQTYTLTPLFRYKSGMKPDSSAKFVTMLEQLNLYKDEKVTLTLNITYERVG